MSACKVDRVACPWLIKKFVDPDAEFLFVPNDQVPTVAKSEGAILSSQGARLGHHGGNARSRRSCASTG